MTETKLQQEGYIYSDSFRKKEDADFRASMYKGIGIDAKIATIDIDGQNLYRLYIKEV